MHHSAVPRPFGKILTMLSKILSADWAAQTRVTPPISLPPSPSYSSMHSNLHEVKKQDENLAGQDLQKRLFTKAPSLLATS